MPRRHRYGHLLAAPPRWVRAGQRRVHRLSTGGTTRLSLAPT